MSSDSKKKLNVFGKNYENIIFYYPYVHMWKFYIFFILLLYNINRSFVYILIHFPLVIWAEKITRINNRRREFRVLSSRGGTFPAGRVSHGQLWLVRHAEDAWPRAMACLEKRRAKLAKNRWKDR